MRTRDEFRAPPSAWSTNDTGLTALARTSILLITVLGPRAMLRVWPGYRPWMDLAATALFKIVCTIPVVVIWDGSR